MVIAAIPIVSLVGIVAIGQSYGQISWLSHFLREGGDSVLELNIEGRFVSGDFSVCGVRLWH